MSSTVRLLCTIGATARATRLVTDDVITRTWRDRARARLLFDPDQRARLAAGEQPGEPRSTANAHRRETAAELLHCRWCASVWTGTVIALVGVRWGNTWWFRAGSVALTASYAAGLLAAYEEGTD